MNWYVQAVQKGRSLIASLPLTITFSFIPPAVANLTLTAFGGGLIEVVH